MLVLASLLHHEKQHLPKQPFCFHLRLHCVFFLSSFEIFQDSISNCSFLLNNNSILCISFNFVIFSPLIFYVFFPSLSHCSRQFLWAWASWKPSQLSFSSSICLGTAQSLALASSCLYFHPVQTEISVICK